MYTCSACTRAILRPSSLRIPVITLPASHAHRGFATKTKAPVPASAKKYQPIAPKVQPKEVPVAAPASGIAGGIAEQIRKRAPGFTETYVAYGATEALLNECIKPGEYTIPQVFEKDVEIPTDDNGVQLGLGHGWWYETLGLTPTFANWTQITFIHMYMLQVRFRMFPATHAPIWTQHLTNHAFYAAEDRLAVWHQVGAASLRQRYMKDMFSNWRAVLLSYDEALVKGDAMMAAAVWRNLFAAREDVDFQKLAQIVSYMRKEIKRLDAASDQDVSNGEWKFEGNPGSEAEAVARASRSMMSERE